MTKYIMILILFLVTSVHAIEPEDRKYTTEVSLSNSRTAVLHWTGVYEGQDKVTLFEIKSKGEIIKEYILRGQPVFNKNKSLVVLPNCADDGCLGEVKFLDLNNLVELESLKIPANSGFKMKCWWEDETILEIRIVECGYNPRIQKSFSYDINTKQLVLNYERTSHNCELD